MFETIITQLTGAEILGFSALVTAAAAIAGIIAIFFLTSKNNRKLEMWAELMANDSDVMKKSLQATDQWILENQQKFTAGMAVINQILTPEQQKQVAALVANIPQWRKELYDATAEVTAIYSPAEVQSRKTRKPPKLRQWPSL